MEQGRGMAHKRTAADQFILLLFRGHEDTKEAQKKHGVRESDHNIEKP